MWVRVWAHHQCLSGALMTTGMSPITPYARNSAYTMFPLRLVSFLRFFLLLSDGSCLDSIRMSRCWCAFFRFFLFLTLHYFPKSVQLNDDGNRQWKRKCHKMPNKTFQLIFCRFLRILHSPQRRCYNPTFNTICCCCHWFSVFSYIFFSSSSLLLSVLAFWHNDGVVVWICLTQLF